MDGRDVASLSGGEAQRVSLALAAEAQLLRDGRVAADGRHEAIATGRHGDWVRAFLNAGTG